MPKITGRIIDDPILRMDRPVIHPVCRTLRHAWRMELKTEADEIAALWLVMIAQAMRKPGRRHCDPIRRRVRQASVRRRITRTHRAITLAMARMGTIAYMGRQVNDWAVPSAIHPENRFFTRISPPVWRCMALIRWHRDLYPQQYGRAARRPSQTP